MSARLFRLTAAALALAGLLAAVAAAQPSLALTIRPPDPPVNAQLVPRSGALLGAFVNPDGINTQPDSETEVTALERSLGRTLDIDLHYNAWTEPLDQPIYRWDIAGGRIPLISWAGYNTQSIANGSQDGVIRAQATSLKALRAPVFVRFGWEMTGRWMAKWVVSPSSYVAAWRRIHDIFSAQGVTNAVWVWCPDHGGFDRGTAAAYYPGNDYVDWVAADGYNRAPVNSWAKWRTVASLFQGFYNWGVRTGKPLMIAETGVMEDGSGRKAGWLADAQATIKAHFPAIKAFMYWDATGHLQGKSQDFRLTTSASAFAAYRAVTSDPYFNQSHGA